MIFIPRTYKVFYVVILFTLSSYITTAQEYKEIPGDTALEKALLWKISLLRQKGYTLTPLF
jgi:hypothetical protein